MSHTTEVNSVVFTDIESLKAAVLDLNKQGVACELVEKTTARAYYANQQGMSGTLDYVLRMKGACPYDVAFVKDEKLKGYVARTDLWGGHIAQALGAKAQEGENPAQAALGKLYQGYAIQAATRQAVRQGYSVRKVTKEDGTVQLVMNVH